MNNYYYKSPSYKTCVHCNLYYFGIHECKALVVPTERDTVRAEGRA